MAEVRKEKKKNRKKFFKRLTILSFVFSFLLLGIFFFLNILPIHFFALLGVFLLCFDFLITYLLLGRGWKKRMFGTFLAVLKIILLCIVFTYLFQTMDFLNKISSDNYNTKNYSIIVLKDSDYEKLRNLKDRTVGIVSLGKEEDLNEAKKHLEKKVDLNYKEDKDYATLLKDLLNKDIAAILVEDAQKKILEEDHTDFMKNKKVVYTFSIDIKIEDDLAKDVDIIKKPFNLFISGIDSYGKITSVSRSDVNMVITVNPTTNKILLTSIPRDYFVKLNGVDTTYKDKLTHAGIQGIDTSVKTVEDLLGIDINYYAKVNFTSLISLVDELGGIDVEVDEAFRAYYEEDQVVNYSFKKGINHLNGKQALAFARERKSLALGDVSRVKHQQMILEGIFNKVLSKNIIIKYNDVLNALEGKFVTNFGTQNITKLVKNQLKDNPEWTLEKYTLTGENASEYTYSYHSSKVYVMIPDEESLREAKNKIKRL